MRIAIVASHPIQYQAPWFRALAAAADVEVFYGHRQDAAGQAAAGFGRRFEWDVPLLDGYAYRWLDNVAAEPSVDRFGGCDTPGIGTALSGGGFDACIVHGWYLKSCLQAIRACWKQRIPVLVRGDSQLAGPRRGVTRAVKYLPYRWLLRRIDAHLYVGTANRAYLRHYGVPESRLFFVPHFVETSRFSRDAAAARADGRVRDLGAHLGVPDDAAVALFAGKLIEKKRPADFVEAVAALARDGHRVHGVIVGSGPLEGDLRARVGAGGAPLSFAGFRNQSEMPVCYGLAGVLVLPSDGRETWGLVVNEAMSAGVPAVVSAQAGCAADLADDQLAGFAYPCGDVHALAGAIARALETRRQRRTEMRAALETKMRTFSLERAVSSTLDAIEQVRSRGGARSAVSVHG